MFARFNANPAMTLQDIKETKCYGRMHGRTHRRTDNVKTLYPLQTKLAGGITNLLVFPKLSLGNWNSEKDIETNKGIFVCKNFRVAFL